jgi:hypothetical protein
VSARIKTEIERVDYERRDFGTCRMSWGWVSGRSGTSEAISVNGTSGEEVTAIVVGSAA